jgi:hypothetical protein
MSLGTLHYHDCQECGHKLTCFRPITHATTCDTCSSTASRPNQPPPTKHQPTTTPWRRSLSSDSRPLRRAEAREQANLNLNEVWHDGPR